MTGHELSGKKFGRRRQNDAGPAFRCTTAVWWLALLTLACAAQAQRPFDPARDTTVFVNDTVFDYRGGEIRSMFSGGRLAADKPGERLYMRRCFVLARATVQFWKFARFDPAAPALDDAALATRVRAIARRSVWRPQLPEAARIVIPGYRDLRAFSIARPRVLQDNLGLGWPTYFRIGNYGIMLMPSHAQHAQTAAEIDAELARGDLPIVWLINFPNLSMNHAVVVYRRTTGTGRKNGYRVYDPNYADGPRQLAYDPAGRTFSYDSTYYFKGGLVHVKPIYRSHWK